MTGRWWPHSVRARLAVWHGLALLAVVSIYAVAVWWQMRVDLYEQLDGELRDDIALATDWLRRAPADALARGPMSADLERHHVSLPWIEGWSTDGHRLFATAPGPGLPPPADVPVRRHGHGTSVRLDEHRWVRVMSRPVTIAGRTIILRIGRSERETHHELGEFGTALVVSLPFAFLAACGAGYLLAHRALAPVTAMTARARRITADHLEDRLPVADARDEFGQLATVINGALERLELSFTTLRRFTADASHELRTPLTAIRSVGEVGLSEHRDETAYREIIGSILEDTARLTATVDALLVLSRADAGRVALSVADLDLADLVREVADDLAVLAEEKHQPLAVEASRGVRVSADRATLRTAVINLVDNAIKYSPDGAPLRIVVSAGAEDAVIEVRDAGPGIAPEHIAHVFERFYRVDEARSRAMGGAGLGLSIAKWAVEANHGRIEAESPASGGSVFRITLPRS